jgi:hypothetical protein
MANLSVALAELRLERDRTQKQLGKLNEAIVVIEGISGSAPARHSKRNVTAASRKKMALAQRARWARIKAGSTSPTGGKASIPQRKPVSIATRRKLAAAQRARWAKQKQSA